MLNPASWKSSLVALGAMALLAACGGGAPEAESPEAAPESAEVTAMATCPEVNYCRVSTSSIRCANGRIVYAFQTDDGWCISQTACSRNGGPLICGD
jgi:hypothetical protein